MHFSLPDLQVSGIFLMGSALRAHTKNLTHLRPTPGSSQSQDDL